MRYLVALLALSLGGCTILSHKEYARQREEWQSIGRLTAIVECQQYMLTQQQQQKPKEESKVAPKPTEEKVNVKGK